MPLTRISSLAPSGPSGHGGAAWASPVVHARPLGGKDSTGLHTGAPPAGGARGRVWVAIPPANTSPACVPSSFPTAAAGPPLPSNNPLGPALSPDRRCHRFPLGRRLPAAFGCCDGTLSTAAPATWRIADHAYTHVSISPHTADVHRDAVAGRRPHLPHHRRKAWTGQRRRATPPTYCSFTPHHCLPTTTCRLPLPLLATYHTALPPPPPPPHATPCLRTPADLAHTAPLHSTPPTPPLPRARCHALPRSRTNYLYTLRCHTRTHRAHTAHTRALARPARLPGPAVRRAPSYLHLRPAYAHALLQRAAHRTPHTPPPPTFRAAAGISHFATYPGARPMLLGTTRHILARTR